MSIPTPTPATTAAAGAPSPTASGTTKSPAVNQTQFLQLLMAELKNQNPMSPNSSDPMQFVTELAQFTSLEQQTNTAQSTSQMAAAQNSTEAVALIGKSVTYSDPSAGAGTGTVQSVNITSSGATLTIGGTAGIALSSVTQVS